jgi:hypothetical protein
VGLAALELALGLGLGDAFTLAFWHDLTLEFSNRIKQIEHQLASRCSLPRLGIAFYHPDSISASVGDYPNAPQTNPGQAAYL